MLLQKPHHTEKALSFNSQRKYVFIADIQSNKPELKKEIAKRYNVHVEAIRTSLCKPRKVKRYTRKSVIEGTKSGYKKVIVTLREGDTIDVYEPI